MIRNYVSEIKFGTNGVDEFVVSLKGLGFAAPLKLLWGVWEDLNQCCDRGISTLVVQVDVEVVSHIVSSVVRHVVGGNIVREN